MLYGSLKITEETAEMLILNRSKRFLIFFAIFQVVALCLWFWVLISHRETFFHDFGVLQDAVFLLFLLSPLINTSYMYKIFKDALFGDEFKILKKHGIVSHNSEDFARFSDVQSVQINKTKEDGSIIYVLSLLMKDHTEKVIESTSDEKYAYLLADKFSGMIEVPLVKKDSGGNKNKFNIDISF